MVSGLPLRTVTVRPCPSDTSQSQPLAPARLARSSTACARLSSSARSQVKPGCLVICRAMIPGDGRRNRQQNETQAGDDRAANAGREARRAARIAARGNADGREAARRGARGKAHQEPRGEAPPDAIHRPADARHRSGAAARAAGCNRRPLRARRRATPPPRSLARAPARRRRGTHGLRRRVPGRRPAGAAHPDPQYAQGTKRGEAAPGLSGAVPPHQRMLRLEPLLKADISLAAPQELGESPLGRRRINNITGGTFRGERLSGKVLPGGADWQVIRTDGVADLDARYTLETSDGALIYVRNHGYRHGPADVLKKLASGEEVDPSLYYMRT